MSEQWSDFKRWKRHCSLSTLVINTFYSFTSSTCVVHIRHSVYRMWWICTEIQESLRAKEDSCLHLRHVSPAHSSNRCLVHSGQWHFALLLTSLASTTADCLYCRSAVLLSSGSQRAWLNRYIVVPVLADCSIQKVHTACLRYSWSLYSLICMTHAMW